MVRHRSNSTTFKSGRDTPETPLTPRSPRSPHLHRTRLLSPPFSQSSSRSTRKRGLDTDIDCDTPTLQASSLPNTKPTPSEMLSRGLNSLALHNANTANSTAAVASLNTYPGLTTPSARLSDDAIERYNLSLPFERFTGSPASASTRSPHRTPTREPQSALQSPQSTPVKNRPALVDRGTPPSANARRTSPQHTNTGPFMTDEENNLFLAQSPRAIRTPRKSKSRADLSSPLTPAERPVPMPDMLATTADEPTTDSVLGSSNSSADTMPEEDDPVETESVQSSTGGGDTEKENCTPKLMHDAANPFYVGSTSSSRQTRSSSSSSSSAKPDGSSLGNITRSRRRALGTISPWRWNAIDEQLALSSFMSMKGAKGLDPFDTTSSPMKGGYAVSEWIDGIAHQKSNLTSAESASGSGTAASSSSASSSSSSLALAPASSSASTSASAAASSPSPARNRLSAVSRLSSNASSSSSSASSSASSSSSSIPPSLGSASQGKGAGKLPEHHPNSTESAERRSSLVAKMTENMIQPHSQAFNRRAQQLEGRIHYWKHGTCHLVDEQDKQQWPGEWKFDIYQDPESPEGTPPPVESSSGGSSGVLETPTATYKGKGKMTERQLSGPASKRMKMMREPLGGRTSIGSTSSQPLEASESPMQTGSGIEQDTSPLPPSPSSRAAARRQQQQSQLQDRYDFRERRMLNGPLTSKSRRCGT